MLLSSLPSSSCLVLLLVLFFSTTSCEGWLSPTIATRRQRGVCISSSSTTDPPALNQQEENDDDDDDEYEYIEYDVLTEPEFTGSEWLVGTVMDNNPDKIEETWTRLAVDKDGKNVAIWGDNSEGSWSFDVASQFLAISKEGIFGKKIWAGVIDDYYFSQGTVRGWNFFSAAAVLGQWQAKRLGVDPDEAGVAPWFEEPEEVEKEEAKVVGSLEEAKEEIKESSGENEDTKAEDSSE